MNVSSIPALAGTAHGAPAAAPKDGGAPDWQVSRRTYDAHGSIEWMLPFWKGKLIRSEGDAPVADQAVNAAHDNAKTVFDFYRDVLGRNGIDGKGMTIDSVVHGAFPSADGGTSPNNAAWYRGKMIYGDGDGKLFSPLTGALDAVVHELTHGLTEKSAKLVYAGQSGALNESWSDVMGELTQQWRDNKDRFADPAYAREHEWTIGEDVFTPGVAGDALRSMSAPGTAFPGDDQPANMKDYHNDPIDPQHDNGGVHTNSGIPNHAAYEAAIKIGDEKLAKIWYKAQQDYLKPRSTFFDAAQATIKAAGDLYHDDSVSQAVSDAWKAVGVDPKDASVSAAGAELPDNVDELGAKDGGFVPPNLKVD